jgi:putative transposase
MAGKRDKPEEIVLKLRQVEVLQGQGISIADAVRQIGVTQQTYYRWRKEYGGMSRDRCKDLIFLGGSLLFLFFGSAPSGQEPLQV